MDPHATIELKELLSREDQMQILKYARTVNAFRAAECAICFEGGCDAATTCYRPTAHRFHEACLDGWRHYTERFSCPLCRADLENSQPPYFRTPTLGTLKYADLLRVVRGLRSTDARSRDAMSRRLATLLADDQTALDWCGVVEEALDLDGVGYP